MSDFIVRNFQAVKEVKLSVKGLTVIIGESSQGKSSTIKAIKAATLNRFKTGQVRFGEEYADVIVRHGNDILSVKRSYKGASPIMVLNKQQFSKLGRVVPPQIEEFNNYGIISVNDSNYYLNFHDQFQKPLLLEFSQKKVMEILSSSKAIDDYNLSKQMLTKKREQNRGAFNTVSVMLSESNAELSKVKQNLSSIEADIKDLKLNTTNYTNNSSLQIIITACKDLQRKYNKLLITKNYLSDLLSKLSLGKSLQDNNQTLSSIKNLYRKYLTLANNNKKLSGIVSDYSKYSTLEQDIKENKYIINNVNALLKQYRSLTESRNQCLRIVKDKICPVCNTKIEYGI